MPTAVNLLLYSLIAFSAIPVLVLGVEVLAAVWPQRAAQSPADRLPTAEPIRFVVLIPAHDENAVIASTLRGLHAQLPAEGRVVVVADNCRDNTAALARAHGATVLERTDPIQRGKGYALAHGLAHLAADPPAVVVMLDADCALEPGALAALVQTAAATGRPTQAVYLQRLPPDPGPADRISAFAFAVKNLARPLGLARLGAPVLLTGSGMAFPWSVIHHAPLASGNLVEDMQLGLDLAVAGHLPLLEPRSRVWGELPRQRQVATGQRTRWEHGHLHTLLTQTPRLVREALRQRRPALLALALELAVPPLALLTLGWLALAATAVLWGLAAGFWGPAAASGGVGLVLAVAIGAAWLRFGRAWLPFRTLSAVPLYLAWKLPLYLRFLFRRQTTWVRTARSAAESADMQLSDEQRRD